MRRLSGWMSRAALAAALAVGAMGAAARGAAAQVPTRPDTLPRDTVRAAIPPEAVTQDSIPEKEAVPDSLRPAPTLPRVPRPGPTGWAVAVWHWQREELLRFQGTSLNELLARVPGLTLTRAGGYGRPIGVSAFGLGGGRLRVFRDGFELDPFFSATLDLDVIGLAELEEVRVVRALNETRVELFSYQLPNARPYSAVEVGTGTPDNRVLRGLFARPTGARSILSADFDLIDSDGYAEEAPFKLTNGSGRWSYRPSQRAGVQLEYRIAGVERAERTGNPFAEGYDRRDLVLQGRAEPTPGLTFTGRAARTSWRTDQPDTLAAELSATQLALGATFERRAAWVETDARLRSGDERGHPTPDLELSGRLGLRPLPAFLLLAEARSASGDASGTELAGTARLGPVAGLSLFASASNGTRVLGLRRDTIVDALRVIQRQEGDSVVVDTLRADTVYAFPAVGSELRATRLGAEWARGGITLGAAFLSVDADSVVPYGLRFDAQALPTAATAATGVEAYASFPLFTRPLRLEGWYTRWNDTGGRPYLPQDEWAAALLFHRQYYTGNLEPALRLEVRGRGQALIPALQPDGAAQLSDSYALANLYFQLRIIDVFAFVWWENVFNNQLAADLPGLTIRPRILYGVRWRFFD